VRRVGAIGALAVLLIVAGGACSRTNTNVVPPKPGIPASAARIAGIYRTVQGSLLQLRDDGYFFLLAGAGTVTGQFALDAGALTVRGGRCGARAGHYTVRVTGRPKPNEARLEFTLVDDGCALRRTPLLDQRWVYVES
jgi:hypothetical protein